MNRPTPDELERLRAAYPRGAPRFDYRTIPFTIEPPARRDDAPTDAPDEDNAPVPIAISSEVPVLRYDWWDDEYYYEVLDHSPSSVILDYCRDGMPFCASHVSWDADQQHGIVEGVTIDDDRVMRGLVRFSRAPRSQEIRRDMLDGIRRKVSVGYIVGDQFDQTEKADDGIPIRRYTAWMPVETSTVPIPADYSVGVGRAQSEFGQAALRHFASLVRPTRTTNTTRTASGEVVLTTIITTSNDTSGDTALETAAASRAAAVPPATHPTAAPVAREKHMQDNTTAAPAGTAPTISVTDLNQRAAEAAQQRIHNITEMAKTHGCMEQLPDWLRSGKSELEVAREINGILAERIKAPMPTLGDLQVPAKDLRRFNIARALMVNTELEAECRKAPGGSSIDFGFERELAAEMRHIGGFRMGNGNNVLPFAMLGRAGVDSATGTTGGAFKFTQPGEFIPLLRNRTSVFRAGVTVLSGLTGPLTFPKQTSAVTAAWSAENPGSDISVTNLLTTTVTLSHKNVGAGTAYSRQMLFVAASGNNDIEAIIQQDLSNVIGLAIDYAALAGSGSSNQPLGVLNNTNIGLVTLGANGGTMAWDQWVDLETKIGDANADTGRMSYITNTKQRGRAKKTAVLGNTASGVPIWTGSPGEMDGVVNGYRALASNQVPSNLTKGTSTTICSAVLFGAWEHLLIGMFGPGFETIVDPYSKKYQGMVEVSAWSYMDVGLRYDGALAAVKDAL